MSDLLKAAQDYLRTYDRYSPIAIDSMLYASDRDKAQQRITEARDRLRVAVDAEDAAIEKERLRKSLQG